MGIVAVAGSVTERRVRSIRGGIGGGLVGIGNGRLVLELFNRA